MIGRHAARLLGGAVLTPGRGFRTIAATWAAAGGPLPTTPTNMPHPMPALRTTARQPGPGRRRVRDENVSDVTPISELFERGASRGYVLLSELQELYDPLVHVDNWVDDMAQQARDLGMQVLDDLVEDADRPEAQPLSASSDSVRQYLNEIGRTDLLTAEQEVDLAKRYQAGLSARSCSATATSSRPPQGPVADGAAGR